jgi:Molecular chaperone
MKIIGIDLGTSNSAAAVLEGGKPTIIPSSEGTSLYGKAFPSYVAFTKDGQSLVGEPARRQAVANPEGTITAFKRKMGSDFHIQDIRKGLQAAGAFSTSAPEDKEGCRSISRRGSQKGSNNSAGILQRQPKAGHKRRRRNSWTGGSKPGKRANRGMPRIRP